MTDVPPPAPAPAPEPPFWKVTLGTAGGVFLGVVFVVGLYAKTLDPEAFVETVRREGLDFLLPAGWVAGIGLALEAVLGFALVLGLRRLRILLPSAALVLFFVFLTARAYAAWDPAAPLDEASCGCFGNLVQRSPAEAFWQDLLLLVPGCALAFVARPRRAAPHTRLRFGLALGLSAAVLVFAWFAPDLPLDDLATRLEPGVHVADLCVGEDRPVPPPGGPTDGAEPAAAPAAREGRICLGALIPELAEGEHVVVLADLADPELSRRVPDFNAYTLDAEGAPSLFLLTPASVAEIERFEFEQQSAFYVAEGPRAVLRPLYRRLPRSFLVRDGRVTRTWSGWPPLAQLRTGSDGSSPDHEER